MEIAKQRLKFHDLAKNNLKRNLILREFWSTDLFEQGGYLRIGAEDFQIVICIFQ